MSSGNPVSPTAVIRRFRDKPPEMSAWAWARVIAPEFGCGPVNIDHIIHGRPAYVPIQDAVLDCWPDRRLRTRLKVAKAYMLHLRLEVNETKNDIALLRAEMDKRATRATPRKSD